MTTSPAWTPLIIAHASAAAAALLLGGAVLARRKGTAGHRRLGWTWVVLMALVALLSFGIRDRGFGWIHALSVFTLAMLATGLVFAHRGQVARHRGTMVTLYFAALVVTGLFTLLPNRRLGQALLSGLGLLQ
ncbi:DUF2306 domain-containing protein [Ramlibacter sp. MAHUQ-53]|uniref:DUF2306 domain-containing protein n=1 Tax=unclassified Ramlibacter TaxID=2617605 RepID=UPI00362B7B8F